MVIHHWRQNNNCLLDQTCPERPMYLQCGINSSRMSDVQLYRPSSWSLYLYSLMNALCLALLRWSWMLEDQAFCDFSFWLSGLQPVHSPRWCSPEWVPLSGCVCPIWGSSPAVPFFFFHSVPCKGTQAHVSSFLITSIQVNSGPYDIFHTKDGLLLSSIWFFTRMEKLKYSYHFFK